MTVILTPELGTSGSTNFAETRDMLIEDALALLNGLAPDQTFSAFNSTIKDRITRRLNAMLKAWQADGICLWKLTEYVIPFAAGQEAYEITPRALRVWNVRRRMSSGTEIPLGREGQPMSRNEYMMLTNKTAPGTPVVAYYDRQRETGVMYVWPVPQTGTTDSLVLTGEAIIEDLDAADDYPDLPQEWHDAIVFNLARRIKGTLGAQMDPDDVLQAEVLHERLRGLQADMGPTYLQAVTQ